MRQAVTMMSRAGRTRQRGLWMTAANNSRAVSTASSSPFHAKVVETSKAYTSHTMSADDLRVVLPAEVHREVGNYIREIAPTATDVDKSVIDKSAMPLSQVFFRQIETERILHGPGVALLPKIDGLESIHDIRLSVYAIAQLIGEPLVQNTEGHKGILVYDRDSSRKMADGQRYHQSREGGSLHTPMSTTPTSGKKCS